MDNKSNHDTRGNLDRRSFSYDLALTPSIYSMPSIINLVAKEHLLFGGDYVFAPSRAVSIVQDALNESPYLTVNDRLTIGRDNGLTTIGTPA